MSELKIKYLFPHISYEEIDLEIEIEIEIDHMRNLIVHVTM